MKAIILSATLFILCVTLIISDAVNGRWTEFIITALAAILYLAAIICFHQSMKIKKAKK